MSLEAYRDVWEHSKAKGTARLILLALADHADENGVAWPSLSRLAKYVNVSKENVCRNISRLIKMGELSRVGTVPSKQGKPGTKYKIEMVRRRTINKAKWCGEDVLNGAEAHHEPSIEPSLSLSYREQHQNDEKSFDEFWQKYPLKVGKGAARKSYLKATKKTSHEKIMDGLSRYDPDPNFICHPSTWLNQERWDDEHDSPGQKRTTNQRPRGRSSRGDGIVEASERFLARRGLSSNIWDVPD